LASNTHKLTLLTRCLTNATVGDIPLTDEKQGAIAVFENQNNLMSETFRNIRTNLQFMLENDKKVILVTSTVSGEGKSFISANLAISLSLLGKKVVIVGLDIRKPGLNKVFNIPRKEVGITQYLANPEKNLMDLVQLSDVSKNLYILPGGTVPPNPMILKYSNSTLLFISQWDITNNRYTGKFFYIRTTFNLEFSQFEQINNPHRNSDS